MMEVQDVRGMNGCNVRDEELEGIIQRLHGKGVVLWVEKGTLRYRAPKGLLEAAERDTLNQANAAIARWLEHNTLHTRPTGRRQTTRRAPLTFTQLAHWSDRRTFGGRPVRQVASVTRLVGELHGDLLERSITIVGRRHDALRTRIIFCDDLLPLQDVADEYCPALEVVNLLAIPEDDRAAEVERQIQRAILEADDYAKTPLFTAVLLAIGKSQHSLILAMDHIISDFASLNIVFSDILTTYARLLTGKGGDLPPVLTQFTDYAVRQRSRPLEAFAQADQRLNHIAATRFPDDDSEHMAHGGTGWGVARFIIDRDLRASLRLWAQRHGTTIVMAVLTAYSIAVLRWCNVCETVVQTLTDGRADPELENTVGYLAFRLYIRVTTLDRSTFLDVLQQIVEEYCRASEEADFGYMSTRVPLPPITRNTTFNWLPAGVYGRRAMSELMDAGVTHESVEFSNPLFRLLASDDEPSVCFAECADAIIGEVHYPKSRFSEQYAIRFASCITTSLTTMLSTPSACVRRMRF